MVVEAKKDAVSVQVKCTPEGRTEEQLGRWHDAPTDNESRATTSLYKLAHLSARDEVRRSEQGMLHCEPEDVWDAKATYKAALQRAADADNGAPPPSRVSLYGITLSGSGLSPDRVQEGEYLRSSSRRTTLCLH